MPIPQTRSELAELLRTSSTKLGVTLDAGESELGPRDLAALPCTEEWTVREVLIVREWWTRAVFDWIDEGLRGAVPATPAEGYAWKETPRLNRDTVRLAGRRTYRRVRRELSEQIERAMEVIDSLKDRELLRVGAFEWAGKWPLARWIQINTARQYTTARTAIRRAVREVAER